MAGHARGFATLTEAADAVAAYLPHRKKPRSPEGLRRNLRLHPDGRWYRHWDPAFLHGIARDSSERAAEMERAAARLRVPLLLLHGGLSDVVSEEGIRAFGELAPTSRIVTISSAAHTAAGDENDALTEAVLDFVLLLGGG
jgi:pimeloyl-ACP methyl ester carboxylesterase